jgi:hypothetical protein
LLGGSEDNATGRSAAAIMRRFNYTTAITAHSVRLARDRVASLNELMNGSSTLPPGTLRRRPSILRSVWNHLPCITWLRVLLLLFMVASVAAVTRSPPPGVRGW